MFERGCIKRLCLFVCLLLLSMTGLRLHAQQTSTICSFNAGPKAGTTHDYAPQAPLPVGSSCQDGAGSTGVIIAGTGSTPPSGSGAGTQTSTICSFNAGPKAGTTHDYAPQAPLPVGSSCQDGAGSTGVIIAGTGSTPPSGSGAGTQTSTICSFNAGPKAGTTHDYAPQAPLPVGSSCQDGAGSTGVIIAGTGSTPPSGSGAGTQTSTICSFNAGPKAGTTHDYAPQAPLPVGSSCQDGAGSTGVIIAGTGSTPPSGSGAGTQTSTICSFNAGPKAGTTHDYAPQAPLPVGSSCQDGAGSTGVIIAGTGSTPPSGSGAGTQTSTICSFNAGPKAGTTHDYAPQAPLPVGSSCQDGAGSTGVIIAGTGSTPPSGSGAGTQTSTICSFNAGPRAGTTQDYAPQAPLPVGSSCQDGAGSTGVIIAGTGSTPPSGSGAGTDNILMIRLIAGLMAVGLVVLAIAGMWKVFSKAGQPGWAVLIPFYNNYILLKIGGMPGWWLLLLLIPLVNIVILAIEANHVAKSFGKSGSFGFFLLFLFPIGYMILGLGNRGEA